MNIFKVSHNKVDLKLQDIKTMKIMKGIKIAYKINQTLSQSQIQKTTMLKALEQTRYSWKVKVS